MYWQYYNAYTPLGVLAVLFPNAYTPLGVGVLAVKGEPGVYSEFCSKCLPLLVNVINAPGAREVKFRTKTPL